jgi:transcription elongation GreA/GreB family factor
LQNSNSIKDKLHQQCLRIAESRITSLKEILQETQDAANNETKSSAGDKHETGRAMAQLETEKLTTQLTETLKLKQALSQIKTTSSTNQITVGSVVFTNNGNFYISASIGKLDIDEQSFFAISPASPIGNLLLTKKEKDTFAFNGKSYTVLSII